MLMVSQNLQANNQIFCMCCKVKIMMKKITYDIKTSETIKATNNLTKDLKKKSKLLPYM